MKDKIVKKFDELTIGEIKDLIPCRDEAGEPLCSNCKFKIELEKTGYCWRNGFFNNLFEMLQRNENIELSDETDELMIKIPSDFLNKKS